MEPKYGYQRIAERSLLACNALIDVGIHEKATFLVYHAFESTGCALASNYGLKVGVGISHRDKLDKFKESTQISKNTDLVNGFLKVAVDLESLRNKVLYPKINRYGHIIKMPEEQVTLAQVKNLKNKVFEIWLLINKVI